MSDESNYWMMLCGWVAVHAYRFPPEGPTRWHIDIGKHRPMRYESHFKIACVTIRIVAWHRKLFIKKNVAYWILPASDADGGAAWSTNR